MKQKICLPLLAVVLLTGAAPLFAQQSLISGGGSTMSSYLGTANQFWKLRLLFTDDTDAFMDPNDYRSLGLQDFFAEAQAATAVGGSQIAGGFAKDFGVVYTSLFFEGAGNDFVFGDDNALSIMIGTASVGAFKPFFRKTTADTLFGLVWGTNISSGGKLFKPEVLVSYRDQKADDYDGLLDAGAALGVDFIPEDGEASLDVQYELKFGIPANSGFFHDHFATLVYRRLYDVTGDFSAGWGAGFAAWFTKGKNSPDEKWGFNPLADLGFTYRMGEVFGINGQLVVSYKSDHNGTTSYIGGFNLIPVLGASFTPHESLKIELGVQPPANLTGVQPWNVSLLASFKK
ncbi:MAG: hypothetical protein LBJ31_04125 [Treponema sp.]|nr:hypothetical protein [Treponema sp.]